MASLDMPLILDCFDSSVVSLLCCIKVRLHHIQRMMIPVSYIFCANTAFLEQVEHIREFLVFLLFVLVCKHIVYFVQFFDDSFLEDIVALQ